MREDIPTWEELTRFLREVQTKLDHRFHEIAQAFQEEIPQWDPDEEEEEEDEETEMELVLNLEYLGNTPEEAMEALQNLEAGSLDEVKTFIKIAAEEKDTDVAWLDESSLWHLDERVCNAIRFTESASVMGPAINNPARNHTEMVNLLLWVLWDRQVRPDMAARLSRNDSEQN